MDEAQQDVFTRLNAAIEAWGGQVAASHADLMDRVATARGRLDGLAETGPATLPAEDPQALRLQLDERETRVRELENQLADGGGDDGALEAAQARIAILESALDNAESRVRALEEALAAEEPAVPEPEEDPGEDSTPEIFEAGLPSGAVIEAFDARGHKRRMGEILVSLGIIEDDELQSVLNAQAADPQRRLGAFVVEQGYAGEDVIARILAAQLRLPYVDLEEEMVSPQALEFINIHLARLHQCFPIREKGDRLVVAMANPLDLIAIEDIELTGKCRVEPVVTTPGQIAAAIVRHYQG